jgi:hypothetical protein
MGAEWARTVRETLLSADDAVEAAPTLGPGGLAEAAVRGVGR